MRRSRTTTASSGSLATLGQRPPRLVLRVVVFSALTLGIGAATLLIFIRHFERERVEHTAMLESSVVTQVVVDRLHPTDLGASLDQQRRHELDRLFRTRVLDDETLAASVVTKDGHVTYATDHSLIGSRVDSHDALATALSGTVASEQIVIPVGPESRRVLRTYAPFRLLDGATGAVIVDKDYAPIASAARKAAIAVAAVLELVLLALWLCLIPVMRTVTKRIHRQLDTIAHMALHDDLTGLPNRTQLGAKLDELLHPDAKAAPFSVLFIDLDRFKEVNDTLGHDRGNELLVEIARRLEATVGAAGLVSRLGGDEFAVVSQRAGSDEALALANRLSGVITQTFDVAGISIEPHASIGIACAPATGANRLEILRRADIAMYAAKRSGTPEVFVPNLDDHSPGRLAMTGELRLALERRELVVHFQPQFDLRRGEVRSAEALVRWQHPTRGLLEPSAFLAGIHHAGLTRSLTGYVLDESLRQLRIWRDAGFDLRLAINVSPKDLADARFPDQIAQALEEFGIAPSALELEITEDVLLLDSVRTGKRLEQIVEQGVRIAIDDFGVGYSSLGQLKNLPAQVLKIDQSFVSGMAFDRRDAAIVRSTIALAHELGLDVIAEGVETSEHVTELRAAGCDIGQGYHLGRPLPLELHIESVAHIGQGVEEDSPRADVIPLRRASA